MTRGPVPARSDQRRRTNSPAAEKVDALPGAVEQPAANEDWHALATEWYESLARSGQARYYEPSDWSTARLWAELLSRQLFSGRGVSAQMMATWHSATTDLLTTEGARRRARMEIERANEAGEAAAPPAPVKASAKARLLKSAS